MLAAQPGGDGEFVGGSGATHQVEEGTALGGEEGSEVVHHLIVDQRATAPVTARRCRPLWASRWMVCPRRRCRTGLRGGDCEDPAPWDLSYKMMTSAAVLGWRVGARRPAGVRASAA
ncbi:hypothetical protein ASD48_11160 [Streptomyces sp. Root1310]|nr:hypothetical protein ASD48_11160 [Streptomyces sp. Root1310]